MTEARIDRPGKSALAVAEPGTLRWLTLALLLLTQAGYQAGIQGTAPLAPFIQPDLNITRAQLGLLGSALSAGTILIALPAGRLADRIGAHLLLFAGPATMGAALLVASRATGYWHILFLMLIAGVGVGMASVAASEAVIAWFTPRTRGTAMGIKQTGTSISGALVAALLPGVALASDWRTALALVGAVIAAVGVVCLIFYRDYAPPAPKGRPVSQGSIWDVLRNHNLQYASAAWACFTVIQMSLVTYLVLYLTEVRGMEVTAAGALLALVQVGGIAGRLILGVVSDRFLGARRKCLLITTGLGSIAFAVVTAFFGASLPYAALAVLVLLFGFVGIGWTGLSLILCAELAGKQAAGQGAAVGTMAGSFGYFAGPPLFGLAVDVTHSYPLAWLGIAHVSALGAALMLRVREREVSSG